MSIFSNEIKLSADFQEGVKKAANNGSWDDVFDHFGSHFLSKVVFGGRYFYEHSYSSESMSFFKSMNLNIETAAKVQFANKLHLNMSETLKKYQSQTNLINSKQLLEKTATRGGEPQLNGSWVDWEKTVRNNLAPISYELTALSVLSPISLISTHLKQLQALTTI